MEQNQMIDHLFRHQFGKMVSILVRIFGLQHMQIIEDAVQDTFIQALQSWRHNKPPNPEAWLMLAAKNRTIDIIRKITADEKREAKFNSGVATIAVQEFFQDHQIADSQLRMIFTACHPVLKPVEQIAFALKAISGFNTKEIAAALLIKEETIKKRLTRARKKISESAVSFEIPQDADFVQRLPRVHEVIYLIFNEGYHSNSKTSVIRTDLVFEAMRLCKILVDKKMEMHETSCALFALMCFHAARMESKLDSDNQIISLEYQDRSKWLGEYISMGSGFMDMAVETNIFSTYHYEAAIAAEHLKVGSFKETDWSRILMWYKRLFDLMPTPYVALNIAIVHLQLGDLQAAKMIIDDIESSSLNQKSYIINCVKAEYYRLQGMHTDASKELLLAIDQATNEAEKSYLKRKLEAWTST